MYTLWIALTLVVAMLSEVKGHGRLMDPAGRASMWRKGFQDVPVDYNDNELFCGGFSTQWQTNGGKCGVCGDKYGGPYDHELGGKLYTDKIAGVYTPGQVFTAEVELTASHKGFFEFKLCAPTDRTVPITQACLDKNLLPLEDGSGTKYKVTKVGHAFHKVGLRLPAGLTCDFCVLQWRYHTGNSFGTDPDSTSCVGCGPQEEFYSCANVAITNSGSVSQTPRPATPKPATPAPWTPAPATPAPWTPAPTTPAPWTPAPATPAPATAQPTPSPSTDNCRAAEGPFKHISGMDGWCRNNCAAGYCPASHCVCGAVKRQFGELTSGTKGSRLYKALRDFLKEAEKDN